MFWLYHTMSSSATTRKSPTAMTAENGMSPSPSLVFSSSSFFAYCVGLTSMMCMSSPEEVSKTRSPTSPNLFPVFETTVLPMSCLENCFSASAILPEITT